MNVQLNKVDAVNATITIELGKSDYEAPVDKALRSYRQKANIPGFRKGMAPMGMLKKLYGKGVLADELNRMVSERLYDYIKEENIATLGEPLPSETTPILDIEAQEDFTFIFDIALRPEVTVSVSKDDKVDYYTVKIADDMIDRHIESYQQQFGSYEKAEVIDEKDMIRGRIVELEAGAPKEGGLNVDEAVMMPSYMKNDEQKALFVGQPVNNVITFNPTVAFEAEAEIASLLKIEKSEVAQYAETEFQFEVTESTRQTKAELNQVLFDKVLGQDKVSDEAGFRAAVGAMIGEQFTADSNYKFMLDARKMLEEKVGEIMFPSTFIKRWLTVTEKHDVEKIDEDYPKMEADLKFHIIKEELIKASEIKLEESDFKAQAVKAVRAQFARYGMLNAPEDLVENYAREMMGNQEQARQLIEGAMEEKLTIWLKEQVTIDAKEVSMEEFSKFFK